MHCIVRRACGGSTDDDNQTARATGHRPDRRSPRRDFLAIPVIGRAANALILGLGGAVDVSTNDGSITLRDLDGPVRASAIGDMTCQLSGVANGGNVALRVYGGTAHLLVPSGERLNTSTGVRATARAEAVELIRTSGAAPEGITAVMERTQRQVTVEVSRGVALLLAR